MAYDRMEPSKALSMLGAIPRIAAGARPWDETNRMKGMDLHVKWLDEAGANAGEERTSELKLWREW
jgi:hypothetical protein